MLFIPYLIIICVFPLPERLKNIDLSCKMDIDLWEDINPFSKMDTDS